MLCALLARDILWLRAILVCAQGNLALYGYFGGLHGVAMWNALFVAINLLWVLRILRERRMVRLAPDLAEIHERDFAALSAAEFLRLWGWSEEREFDQARLVEQGGMPSALYYLLGGQVRVVQGPHEVTRLGPGDFIAEMSLLTGRPAIADVVAAGKVRVRLWPAERLLQLRSGNPALWTRVQSLLGHDLVDKIQRASQQRDAGEVQAQPP